MENENNEDELVCAKGRSGCTYQMDPRNGVLTCVPGDSSCNVVSILEAEESDFHDCHLIEATRAIKAIIELIPPDPNGRNLSFLSTNMGTLLAWVEHGAKPIEGAVTADDDDATVAKALKLIL